ncbi:MAG: trp RNA-binding attenuation protein MtrB [Christensenellales bacterium]|jgi:transcription attenuation protein (tryptophan RNA-binding attenuator protein)
MDEIGGGKYVCIKALEDGVTVIGMSRGAETKPAHAEKLSAGEVMLAQFTERTSAIKIRGRARIIMEHGEIDSGC